MLFIWTDGLRTGQNQRPDGTAGRAHAGRLFGISKKVVGGISRVAGHGATAAGARGGSMVFLLLWKQVRRKAPRAWAATPCTGQIPPQAGEPSLYSQGIPSGCVHGTVRAFLKPSLYFHQTHRL